MRPVASIMPGLIARRSLLLAVAAMLLNVRVAGADSDESPVDFVNDIQPILTRHGCNSGPCHGKARGQGGLQLSLLGFDAQQDYDAIVRESRGRRVFAASPVDSLIIRKPTGVVPHGGGRRLEPGGPEVRLLERWIQQGAVRAVDGAPVLRSVRVAPGAIALAPGSAESLRVTAEYSDGSTRDVTSLAAFQSAEAAVAEVSDDGSVTAGAVIGDTAVMCRYMNHFAICTVTVPRREPVSAEAYTRIPRVNFVDEHVIAKLQRLNILPAKSCDDAVYLRRLTTDLCGRFPTVSEVREFLDDDRDDRRDRLLERLLNDPEFEDYLANQWVDLLRPNPYRVGIKAVFNYDAWIRQQFRERRPWNRIVTDLLTAEGSTFRNGAVTLFRDRRDPEERATLFSRLFLGVRLECAKCHHHPFEIWGQDDFYSFAAWFADTKNKGTGLSPPISGSEEFFYTGSPTTVKHPVTGAAVEPQVLFGTAPDDKSSGLRSQLAGWMTSDENHLFAQVMANRVWTHMMHRGLVEPVDDFRATNPAANQPLLTALGEHFRDSGFQIEELYRVIAGSHVYQLSSIPHPSAGGDNRSYSRHYRHRFRAEVLLDSLAQITEIPIRFSATPPGTNARQLWTHRSESVFLDTFGRPDPNQDPPCERQEESTVVQSLHLMNSESVFADIRSDEGRAARLAASDAGSDEIAEELYAAVFSRRPDESERALVRELLEVEGADRRQVITDLMWAMVNTAEFVLQN